ncbi:MAG TPA: hypothetical protein VGH14_06870 [Solirubrobacterales bacterium]
MRGKLTYSNVMVTILAVLVLGAGSAYATSQLTKESVGTRQLKKEAVTPAKLSKASKAALTGPQGPTGATGPQGPQGTKGLRGPEGFEGETGPAGSARAWADITPAGTIEQGVGFTSVTQIEKGVYCAHLDSTFEPGKFTALATVKGGLANRLFISDFAGGCGSSSVQVNIWEESGTLTNAGFVLLVP